LLLLGGWPVSVLAQEGVPGSRLESAQGQRAAIRAEAYKSVTKFFAEWREAWNAGDATALACLYTDDATLRLPGQGIAGKAANRHHARAAAPGAATLSMTIIDFDSNGEWSILVARYILRREGHLVEGVMTAVMYGHRSSWRLRMQIFDAPEKAATTSGAAWDLPNPNCFPISYGTCTRDRRNAVHRPSVGSGAARPRR
jgi:ketosteroid isomerase-like protein